jgi:hypothetical protein
MRTRRRGGDEGTEKKSQERSKSAKDGSKDKKSNSEVFNF